MEGSLVFKTLGFIGLGAMGRPMLVHLANKLPPESRIFVFDVIEDVVDEVCSQFPDRVLKASSAKDVAYHAVGLSRTVSATVD
jgi:3-hydroxyisobutyrate dehydrogenase